MKKGGFMFEKGSYSERILVNQSNKNASCLDESLDHCTVV